MSTEPCSALLSAVAAELSAMTSMVDTVAALVAEHVGQSQGGARTLALVQAQTADHLNQTLRALSALAAAVAGGADLSAAVDAVPLGDLSHRLRAAVIAGAAAAVSGRSDAGELVLFE
jgi:hypothetical protein